MTLRRVASVGVLVGVVGWLILWFNTEPRASYDSLIYHTHGFEYAGLSRDEADAVSWEVYTRYADPREEEIISGTFHERWSTPDAPRWMGLYEMRPLYPALVAAAYPVLTWRAPMAASAFVTIAFFAVTVCGFWLLFGPRVAAFATIAALIQADFTRWLVFLATDGLGMTLWAGCLVATALVAKDGRRRWYLALGLAVLLLALARPTGSLAPLVPAICAGGAALTRDAVWKRFARAAAVAAVPATLVVVVQQQLGYPGLNDVLQEIATQHFSLPDVADPIGYTVALAWWAITERLLPTLLTTPVLLGFVVLGFAGLLVRPTWTKAPFLIGALVVPVAWVIHPLYYDAGRVLAPVWISVNLGIAFAVEWAGIRWRSRIRATAVWATRPDMPAPG
jgi:hypothetical protein